MAETTYILHKDTPESIPGFEQYQDYDKNLIPSYQVNSLFDPNKNTVELHVLDLADNLIESNYNFRNYTLSLDAASAGKEGASVITLDPIQDILNYGYSFGNVKTLYHFISDLYTKTFDTVDFYIDSISRDRTELSLLTRNLTPEEIVSYTEVIKNKLKTESYFSEFRLNLKNNVLLIGVNIDTIDTPNGKSVVVKLYEPLPENIKVKTVLNIVELISDSVAYEVDYEVENVEEPKVFLRSPNFNIEIQDNSVVPSEYLSYDDLLGYPIGNTNSEIYSMINEKGVELSIDYTDFSNFVHFSSAQERLINFKYKLDLLTSYSASLSTTSTITGGTQGVSGSTAYYQGLYQGIISNFDHYERFLYYESGSHSWPKSNTTKPYINVPSKDPITQIANPVVTAWYTDALTNAVAFDSTNYNILTDTIPAYLRDDESNEKYLTFIYMVGQHFDNLWVYGKAVTDKYNNDNRLDFGISKDLVGEALKNFGVKLYTSNKSTEDLFTTLIGQAYQSGSEKIKYYITGSVTGSNKSIQPTSYDDYQKEVQKRIYHNLPLLLKSKGTERGLRALINCYGISSDILDIKIYGGRNTDERPFFGDVQPYTSSLGKIRLDNTGSIVTGSALSGYTSIIKRDNKYTDDLHTIEVGFSPTDNIDAYIQQYYNTATIGNQVWATRNADVTTYRDGTKIPQATSVAAWTNATSGAWCYYNNDPANNTGYGKLYNWYAVAGIYNAASLTNTALRKQFAPSGWHVPSWSEFIALVNNLGVTGGGGKLKETGTSHWLVPNLGATNETGWTGLPGGIRDAFYGGSTGKGSYGNFWSANEDDPGNADYIQLSNTDGDILTDQLPFRYGMSVRFIKDTTTPDIFDIDDYLGDPNNLTSDKYTGLHRVARTVLESSLGSADNYDLQDYVRLIKFFDNTIFKTIKDFIPARATANTGIIIKPNLLNRSKAKSVAVSATQPEYTGSVDTAFISGSDGNTYIQSTGSVRTGYTDTVQTPQGLGLKYVHNNGEVNFNGEINESYIQVSSKDLNKANYLKETNLTAENQTVSFFTDVVPFACALSSPTTQPIIVTRNNQTVDVVNDLVDLFFSGVTYTSSSYIPKNTAGLYTFPETNYKTYSVTASRAAIAFCSSSASYLTQYCDLAPTTYLPSAVTIGDVVDLRTWYTSGSNTSASFTASWDDGVTYNEQTIGTPSSYTFSQAAGTTVTMSYNDSKITAYICNQTASITVQAVPTVHVSTRPSTGTYYGYASSSNASSWTLPVTNGVPSHYGDNSTGYVTLIITNTSAAVRVRLEWLTPVPQPGIYYSLYRPGGGSYSFYIELPYGQTSVESPIVTIPPGSYYYWMNIMGTLNNYPNGTIKASILY